MVLGILILKHINDFTSKILHGRIINWFWKVTDGDTHTMDNESCSADKEAPRLEKSCGLVIDKCSIFEKGDSYHVTTDMYHNVFATDCITLLERGPKIHEFAQVIVPKGEQSVCPFSIKVPESVMWEIIEDMLKKGS